MSELFNIKIMTFTVKKNLPIIFFLLNFKLLIGQITIKTNTRYSPIEYNDIIIDKTKKNIYYTYVEKGGDKKISSKVVLQISDNFSKFMDVYTLKTDSIQKKQSKLQSLGSLEINKQFHLRGKIGFKKNVLKNLKSKRINFTGKVYDQIYDYKMPFPKLKWKLEKGKKEILGYSVRKAIVNYGGRNWIAWYTEEIPVALGPYVFGDLPGLIMEIHDDKKIFHFTAIGMDTKTQEIYKRNEKRIKEISKEEFMKAERNFHERPDLYFTGTVKGGGTLKKIPYNPIELKND